MNKEKLKKIKVLYYPYKAVKKIITGIIYYIQYIISLFYISQNKNRVEKKISNGKVLNVVFVVQYIPGWNKLEPIYSKMLKDQRFNPIIVCVPLNIQNHILMDDNGNDTYQYFIEHGYKAIDALLDDGSWFDLKKLEPDYLYHSRPYNAFMPKCYTSGKIVKYVLICNVLYGMNITKDIRPVTINKEYFKDVFCYFSADINDSTFYRHRLLLGYMTGIQKCYPFGAIGLEQIIDSRTSRIPKDFKKTAIWTPRWSTDSKIGGSNFFNYKQTILDLADALPDVLFIIRPHPLMFTNFIQTGEMTVAEVANFKDYCRNKINIILDEKKEYAQTFWNSDFLISDISSIIPEYFVTKKPIIYCNSNIRFQYTETAKEMLNTCYEVNNATELEKITLQLIGDKDTQMNERENIIHCYFNDVEKNSRHILDVLSKNLNNK